MRKAIAGTMLVAGLTFAPVAVAGAQTDPNDVESVDNPVDENDNSGFDDWGLFGLLGLLGLAGLAKKRDHHRDDLRTTRTVDPEYSGRR